MEVSAEGYLAVNFLFDFFLLCLPARGTWFFRPERLVPAALPLHYHKHSIKCSICKA